MSENPMEGYDRRDFLAPMDGREKVFPVYEKGAGPPVVLIQELPGIGRETLALSQALQDAGFRVSLPHLFGPLGRTDTLANTVRVFCMRREFALFERNQSSPIVEWLAALCRDVRGDHVGVGVIGMCLTGNFAISLMADEAVLAGVAAQPSLPLRGHANLHMSPGEVEAVCSKLDRVGPMLAYRFEGDSICRAEKFSTIERKFNADRERIRLRTLPGPGHSVLTLDFCAEPGHPTRKALDEVIQYFQARLSGAQSG